MTNLEVISGSFQGLLAQACLSALLAIVGVAAAAKVLKNIRVAFSSLWRKSRFSFAAVMLLFLTMFLWADKTNLLRMIIHPGGPPVVVSAEDILRGFRLEGIVTNDEPLCDMPVDAVEYPPWRIRAGRHTEFTLDLGDFVFPYGTNVINRFRVLPGGTIETFSAQGTRVSICAARDLASLSPGVSRFWSADANGGAEKVLRWDSVFANDDRTGGYSAEIRLSANGDFSTRSNEVESVFRRVSPHDWDGDGLANEIDANPYESDGDFFGPVNILPEGANSNAYCSVSVLVPGADALVSFVGDKPSNYPAPQFIARHGVTNNVSILIGKTYDILCDQSFAVVGVSDPATEILVSEGQVRVVRPVEIECVQEPGTGFSMNVNPSNLGGAFTWNRDCCQIVSNVTSNPFAFSFVENLECVCLRCQARGEYGYEGYSLSAYGRMCPCYRVGDEPNLCGDTLRKSYLYSTSSPLLAYKFFWKQLERLFLTPQFTLRAHPSLVERASCPLYNCAWKTLVGTLPARANASRQAYSRVAPLKAGAVAPGWQELSLSVVIVVSSSSKLIPIYIPVCSAGGLVW